MLDEHCGRDRAAVKDVERHRDDLGAVLFREVRDRSDQARSRLTELGPAFRRRVLPHDGARIGAARLLKRAQRAERARIVDRADQRPARLAVAQVPPHRLEALAELAVAVEMRHLAVFEMREDLFHADQHPGQAHLRQAAGALERDQDDLVDLRMPVLLGPASEEAAADQPGLVVVRPEVGRTWMRHLDRDERNVRLAVLGADNRRDVLVGLELDDEVDLFSNQNVGVALGDFRVVPVVERDQFDALRGGGALEAERHLLRERVVRSLRGIAKPVEFLFERPQRTAIEVFADLVDHAAPLERVEQPERHALRQTAPGRDIAQRQRLAGRTKRRQQAGRMDDRLHQVRIARGCFTAHMTPSIVYWPRHRGAANARDCAPERAAGASFCFAQQNVLFADGRVPAFG